jgi:DNA-binding transcriptional ArsR family regulator
VNSNHNGHMAISRLAAAIGDPSRARMLCCLLDGHARTSTELAMVAAVSPSTASVHLNRLKAERLVKLLVQGKHRYYSLEGAEVASALEALMIVAGGSQPKFTPTTPEPLRHARTCYDHMAGSVAVALHHRFQQSGWIKSGSIQSSSIQSGSIQPIANPDRSQPEDALHVTPAGERAFESLGVDIDTTRSLRRRFAYACLDWSERKPHIGGSLGAALLQMAFKKKWLQREFDSRALHITRLGQRELAERFGIQL